MTANKVEAKISDMDPQISKDVCAICLECATAGHGKSLFVSECSHTFHFDCIAKSVSHANRTCPNCRSTWIHLPSLAPNPPPNDPSNFSDSDSSDTSDSDSSSSSLALDPNNNLFNRPNNYVYPLPARSYYSSRPSSTPILSSPSPISARTSTRGGAPHSADRTPLIKKIVKSKGDNKAHNNISYSWRAARECKMRDGCCCCCCCRSLTLTRPVDPRRNRFIR